eukprot:339065-Lingulodinium_polyedra.AAC.1
MDAEEGSAAEATAVSATVSSTIDPMFGDGRVPAAMNWGIQDRPERVEESALCYLIRRGPRTN